MKLTVCEKVKHTTAKTQLMSKVWRNSMRFLLAGKVLHFFVLTLKDIREFGHF